MPAFEQITVLTTGPSKVYGAVCLVTKDPVPEDRKPYKAADGPIADRVHAMGYRGGIVTDRREGTFECIKEVVGITPCYRCGAPVISALMVPEGLVVEGIHIAERRQYEAFGYPQERCASCELAGTEPLLRKPEGGYLRKAGYMPEVYLYCEDDPKWYIVTTPVRHKEGVVKVILPRDRFIEIYTILENRYWTTGALVEPKVASTPNRTLRREGYHGNAMTGKDMARAGHFLSSE